MLTQYHWILCDGAGVAWLYDDHPEWTHADAAAHAGLEIEHCAKGIIEAGPKSAIVVVQTPGRLTELDRRQLQRIVSAPVMLVYVEKPS